MKINKKYLKKFKVFKLVVYCKDIQEAQILLSKLDELGFQNISCNSKTIIEDAFGQQDIDDVCFCYDHKQENKRIQYDSKQYFSDFNIEIVTFKQFFSEDDLQSKLKFRKVDV